MTDAVDPASPVDVASDPGAAAPPGARPARTSSGVADRPRRRRRYNLRESLLAYLLLLPSALVFAFFFIEPFIRLIGWGRYQPVRGGVAYNDVGMDRYKEVLGGEDFRQGLWHSIQFVLLTVPAGLVLGILLAVAAHRRLKGIKIFQTIFSSTLASSVAVASVLFLFIFNQVIGVWRGNDRINLLFFKTQPQYWAQTKNEAMWAAALPSIWQNLGLAFVIVLAGLQAVPDEVVEAATLDGYGPIRRFFRITLPLISPVLLFLVMVLVVFGFQAFAQIEIVTSGGPAGATQTLVFKIFQQRQDLPAAAVMSVGLFVVTLIVSGIQFGLLNRKVHYGDE
jgi:sn-glycerol 3-phosphate transport system permease protein